MSETILKITTAEICILKLNYSISNTSFGEMLISSTEKGIFYAGFANENKNVLADLKNRLPQANFTEKSDAFQQQAFDFLNGKTKQIPPFHLKCTDFQVDVWNALLKIPCGQRVSYQDIALQIGKPKACRAVGSAIGKNPVAVLIPCHRVLQSSGGLGGFYWGLEVKKRILEKEKS